MNYLPPNFEKLEKVFSDFELKCKYSFRFYPHVMTHCLQIETFKLTEKLIQAILRYATACEEALTHNAIRYSIQITYATNFDRPITLNASLGWMGISYQAKNWAINVDERVISRREQRTEPLLTIIEVMQIRNKIAIDEMPNNPSMISFQ